jgi:HPt (histidine-containing phosphotransfer) domain-containing protein
MGEAAKVNQPALDMAAFGLLRELLGADLKDILSRHFDTSRSYMKAIDEALAHGDAEAVYQAAHPFKSSSLQIGARRVADLAGRLEGLSRAKSPDMAKLREIAAALAEAQRQAESEVADFLK